MTINLDLPPDVETILTREAQRQGTTPESLLLGDIRRLYSAAADTDQAQRHAVFAAIITQARALTPVSPEAQSDDPAGEAIAEKFRRQGFQL